MSRCGWENQRVVIVGSGLAGSRASTALRKAGFSGHITIIDGDGDADHDRPPLTKGLLKGTQREADIRFARADKPTADAFIAKTVVASSMRERRLFLDDDSTIRFDGLIIASGLRPKRLSHGMGSADVPSVRTLRDAQRLRATLMKGRGRSVVIGAGYIGTEVAAAARSRGWQVDLLARTAQPLEHALGRPVGQYIGDIHYRHGVNLMPECTVTEVARTSDGFRVDVDGRRSLDAELVVAAVGSLPNVDWLAGDDVLIDDGVRTDSRLRVLDRSGKQWTAVVAAGDVVRWPHPLFPVETVRVEHWSNAAEQAASAARVLLSELDGREHPAQHDPVPTFWSDQYDQKILAVGMPHLADRVAIAEGSPASGRFVAVYTLNDYLVGAVGVGSASSLARHRRVIAEEGAAIRAGTLSPGPGPGH
ncbi:MULTISPECIES: NAD(P)/FAD-dependent oxidoreductase [Brevibacterium]|mgnify:CR=1 FL=1|jgi:3-phenylpropionate/trans-cinnamate dioxygenase ferredoxin reductase subunit|uniref:FAD-dependent oxidoreductase n=3 Tax=Bacteria TaxID=2 RepID=A0A7T4A204_9MICO|nr:MULTISPECIES: FAD-dependent oxidoreductase [Brevibacterium]MCM1013488.1 FAD-dependent oxidoreductase [Brevibacterium sp. XM4083]MCT1446150.1 FAD-dependent oxidoreductase [Brevibacterium casei]MCT1764998.1 FAD-dependent oxidoreductase [Brevibacterium casei]MCT2182532.1 FAD-dependent oxidoreductase [Brevibacterium casei]MDH5149870.1 FAD-dependent oxidoreductase [Brevibacterium casei]